MALNIDELIQHAKEYVEREANAVVLSAEHHESFTLFDREDVVLSVVIDDDSDPEWWVIGGYDAFICHASEDKDVLVRPLAEILIEGGFDIWYDEFELTVGDSLRQSIDRGLASSRFGIVVLSPAFLGKNWPQYELNGLTAREIEGEKVILPVWHEVTKQDVLRYSPSLADKVAISTQLRPLDEVADALANVLANEPGAI